MPLLTNPTQEAIALEEAALAVLRMIARGVAKKHVPSSALVMWGIGLMEEAVARRSIALWLRSLAEKYENASH
jgi:hypothetical protein